MSTQTLREATNSSTKKQAINRTLRREYGVGSALLDRESQLVQSRRDDACSVEELRVIRLAKSLLERHICERWNVK